MHTWKLWLCNRSTRLIAHKGSVKPFPPGPAPCVCPVNPDDVVVLAVGRKLVGCVEKQRYDSLKCSFPA